MKAKILLTTLIALAIFLIAPEVVSAQKTTPRGKSSEVKKKQGKPAKNKKTDAVYPGKLPPGQQGKDIQAESEPGFRKTGDKGRKTGWEPREGDRKSEAEFRKEQKKLEKEQRKLMKQQQKERRMHEKQLRKQQRIPAGEQPGKDRK